MDVSGLPQPHDLSALNPTLQIDFTWRKWQAHITELNSPSTPIYIVDFRTLRSPHILVKSGTSNNVTIGTGTLHAVSINAEYEVHGRKGELKAFKRWKTAYTHLSQAFSNSKDDSLATMTWTTSSGFKTWDFICLDEQHMPVAKFSAKVWAVRNIGNIEFMGPKALSTAARDEIVVTGLTLFYCMMLRTGSLLSFFGAIIARPGPIKGAVAPKLQQDNKEEHDRNRRSFSSYKGTVGNQAVG